MLRSGIALFALSTGPAVLTSMGVVSVLGGVPNMTLLQMGQVVGGFAVLTGPAVLLVTIAGLFGRHQAPADGPALMVLTAMAVAMIATMTMPQRDYFRMVEMVGVWLAMGMALMATIPAYLLGCFIVRKSPLLRRPHPGANHA